YPELDRRVSPRRPPVKRSPLVCSTERQKQLQFLPALRLLVDADPHQEKNRRKLPTRVPHRLLPRAASLRQPLSASARSSARASRLRRGRCRRRPHKSCADLVRDLVAPPAWDRQASLISQQSPQFALWPLPAWRAEPR